MLSIKPSLTSNDCHARCALARTKLQRKPVLQHLKNPGCSMTAQGIHLSDLPSMQPVDAAPSSGREAASESNRSSTCADQSGATREEPTMANHTGEIDSQLHALSITFLCYLRDSLSRPRADFLSARAAPDDSWPPAEATASHARDPSKLKAFQKLRSFAKEPMGNVKVISPPQLTQQPPWTNFCPVTHLHTWFAGSTVGQT